MKLTVILTDDSALCAIGTGIKYRRVTVELTAEQAKALSPRKLGLNHGVLVWEEIDRYFLEEIRYEE